MNMPLNTKANTSDPIEQARYNMIEQQIRPWNVLDRGVLETLARVRREDFVPLAYRSLAFMDMEIPLQGDPDEAVRIGQCMLAPRVEARLLQELNLQKNERVLEIGAGSGYMAALLAQYADQVVTLEIDPALAILARENLERFGIRNASVRLGDGARSSIPDGPFDAILPSGSVAEVPSRLLDLLRDGGRLIAIAGQEPVMRVTTVRKQGSRFDVSYPWDTNTARLLNFAEPSAFRF